VSLLSIRILIVDDERNAAALAKRFLEMHEGTVAEIVTSAEEARRSLSSSRYDAVVSDYQMPQEDGLDLLRSIRARKDNIPFILFTGKGREEVVIKAIDGGADGYVQKEGNPRVVFAELFHKVFNAVSGMRSEESLRRSQEELSVAKSRIDAIIAASNIGAWEFYTSEERLWCSPEYFSMLGRDIRDYSETSQVDLEHAWGALLHPDDRRGAEQTFAEYLANPVGMYEQVFRLLHKDGRWLWILSRGKMVPGDAKQAGQTVIGMHIDITGRKAAEEAASRAHQGLLAMMNSIDEAVYLSDPQTYEVVFSNRAIEAAFGECGDRKCYEWLQNRDRPCPYCTNDKVMGDASGQSYVWEHRNDANGRWYRCIDKAIRWEDGRLLRYEMAIDVTKSKAAEELLRTNRLKLSMAMDLARMAHWEFDIEKRQFIFNDQFYALLGTTAEREGGYAVDAEEYPSRFVHPDDVNEMLGIIRANLSSSDQLKHTESEHRVICRDGRIRIVHSSIATMPGSTLPAARLYGAIQDVTEQRQAQAALRETNRKLSLLSSITRHDITNQVLALEGSLALLEDGHPGLDRDEHLKRARAAAERISSSVQFTRSYEDIGASSPTWLDLRAMIDEGASDVYLRAVRLVNLVPEGTEVFADPMVIRVFHNLVDNAVRHGRGLSEVRFWIEVVGDRPFLICEDDGQGIAPEVGELLFTRALGKEHGYGLFLSKEILAITGISIVEESMVGHGARFVIEPPRAGFRKARP
jgi:PAS domain S-box-containing protein